MKKIRIPLCSFCMILILSLCSCGLFGPQSYTCDLEQVESAQIVRLGEVVNYEFNFTVLAEIPDAKDFAKQVMQLEHSVNWGDPMVLYSNDVVIRINYRNGDYDLLRATAQVFHRSDQNGTGFFFFDSAQFNKLISRYMSE